MNEMMKEIRNDVGPPTVRQTMVVASGEVGIMMISKSSVNKGQVGDGSQRKSLSIC